MKQLDLFPSAPTPRPLRVLVDCDGVLSDFVATFLDFVSRHYGVTYERSAVNQWDPFAALGLAPGWGAFRGYVESWCMCRKMSPLPGAKDFWWAIRAKRVVKVATSPQPYGAWLAQRSDWLADEMDISFEQQIHLTDKTDLVGTFDVLIDDAPHNCEAWQSAGGKAFCIAAPYNENVAVPRGDYADCLKWLETVAHRPV
jgi:5'(3')-deoxyribonucleotidase